MPTKSELQSELEEMRRLVMKLLRAAAGKDGLTMQDYFDARYKLDKLVGYEREV